ncbi:universal stress protein (plasmid) [Rhizobium leguminosarum]|uniref:Universal stress protein n=1 Tax=Rhizobium leguminosarum TaxID=384 RepID=A0A4Q8XTE5_RHILE|nr:universal stress protein [Rhizobium leguminosarum]TAU73536.1 universal stress protein [Rhizobium leguminosarum]TAU79300.1 universal stress protein [Rhizobium leguminosarum]TAV40786.1 universal stress protein [Rhizobium leguminosarum]TAX02973.1 universal stress protein [Rhizobium leguminosarum]TAX46913.1 universal stress protein [Rhizobium leguminosarum]
MEIDDCNRGGPREMEQDMTAQYFLPLATYPDSSSGLIISNAVALAGYYGASLHACALTVAIPHIPNAWSSLLLDTPKMIEHAETLSRDRAATLIAAATNLAANAKIELSCRTVKTTLPLLHDTAATEARLFDLAILECIADIPDTRTIAETVIFGSGRPTIIFPNKTLAGPIDHLVIAWDGSRAAARAVSDANPFIYKAKRVSVLSLTGEKPLSETSGAHLAEILVSSGVNASATVARFTSSSIGLSIQRTALELGAELLVMGGFGHSRLRDFVLGGATDGVLGEPLLPILMSH